MGIGNRGTLLLSACIAALVLSGCGGGNSVQPIPIAPPPPPPPPPPLPPPPPPPPPPPVVSADDPEYLRSTGAVSSGAIAAWDLGATGSGVTVAVLDSGINLDLAEFDGRIHPASRHISDPSRSIRDGGSGHGTGVAAVLGANYNGSGMMGVAFESSILMILAFQAPDQLAQAIDYARTNGARSLNMSFQSEISPEVEQAAKAAEDAGMVLVISAGNTGLDNPGEFARDMAELVAGVTIIAGAHDEDRQLFSWSARAGETAHNYLVAHGLPTSLSLEGEVRPRGGTSFSAPIIAGSVALLADLWPHLSGQQITEILFASADDMGEPGVDPIWGHGILNIARAVQPAGQMSFAGLGIPVSAAATSRLSPAMGDAGASIGSAVILDRYGRSYSFDLDRLVGRAAGEQPLHQALDGDAQAVSGSIGATEVSMTVSGRAYSDAHLGLAQAGFSSNGSSQGRVRSGYAVSRVARHTTFAFGLSESGRRLQQRMSGAAERQFLILGDAFARHGFHPWDQQSFGARQMLHGTGLSVVREQGRVQEGWHAGENGNRARYSLASLTADRTVGPAVVSLGFSTLEEDKTVLGGRFSPLFFQGGATSRFVDATALLEPGGRWSFQAGYRRGWSEVAGSGALVGRGRFESDAWSLDISKSDAFASSDRLTVRVAQPLRVRSGGLELDVPVSYDHATQQATLERRQFSLTPSGRELDFEAAYNINILDGAGRLGAYAMLRRHPDHSAKSRIDRGAAVRLGISF